MWHIAPVRLDSISRATPSGCQEAFGTQPAYALARSLPMFDGMRTEIVETEGPSFRRHTRRAPTRFEVVSRVARVIDYLFGLLYALLAVRFVLEIIRARRDVGFFEFIRDLTNVFYAPFSGIVPTDTVDGVRVVWPLVVAVFAYALLHAVVRGLLRLLARG
jgi:hypothetical protein